MSILLEALLREHVISPEQVQEAQEKQLGAKKPLLTLLLEMHSVTEQNLMTAASHVFNMPVCDLDKEFIDAEALKLIPYETAKQYSIIPLRVEADALVIAMSDPEDSLVIDQMRAVSGKQVTSVLAIESQIVKAIEKAYHADDVVYDLLKNTQTCGDLSIDQDAAFGRQAVDVSASRDIHSPAVKLAHMIIHDAIKNRASDIHIEPKENEVLVRYRIDGELRQIMTLPAITYASLIGRIKIMGGIDISENRKPQDGRVRIVLDKRKIDIRISTLPTVFGERVELRVLDPQEAKIVLDRIGLETQELGMFTDAIHRPKGMVLVTGPTGAGKNSTIYAALNVLKDGKRNIITLEDPVEYLMDGINQIQVNPAIDLTFAAGLRSILRQDPDIISVGEIRDEETAEIAFKSAMTGHLVFSTLHTINAVATLSRLMNMGLQPYMLSSALLLIVAQRLVRCICPLCKEEYRPDEKTVQLFLEYFDNSTLRKTYRGRGCASCNFSGYFGRIAIFELLPITMEIRRIIDSGFSEEAVFQQARNHGLRTLAEAGIAKVSQGITTLEEVARVAELIPMGTNTGESPGIQRKGTHILVADDDESIHKLLGAYLEHAGFQVSHARDGEELIALVMSEKPDMVITDVTMPKKTGLEATQQLRSNLSTAGIPILMLTAREDKASELAGLHAGVDDYMTKPFDYEKLLARVQMLLRRSTASSFA